MNFKIARLCAVAGWKSTNQWNDSERGTFRAPSKWAVIA